MLKPCLSLGWRYTTSVFLLVLTGLSLMSTPSAQAETDKVPHNIVHASSVNPFQTSNPMSENSSSIPETINQVDPIDSPYPIPWNWIINTQSEFSEKKSTGLRYYRSPSLISPDGKYAAYTRVQMQVEPELFYSRISSVMFLENLETGTLQVIRANSPMADHILAANEEDGPGTMSILMPVSWSASGNRLLCRQFEGFLSTSDASDYAVVWDRQTDTTSTISPNRVDYTNAVLLGWDHNQPEQVLFRAGILGEEDWSVWAVALNGQTALANKNESVVYGQLINQSWTGSQVIR